MISFNDTVMSIFIKKVTKHNFYIILTRYTTNLSIKFFHYYISYAIYKDEKRIADQIKNVLKCAESAKLRNLSNLTRSVIVLTNCICPNNWSDWHPKSICAQVSLLTKDLDINLLAIS